MVTPIHKKILKEFQYTRFRVEQLSRFYVTQASIKNAMNHLLHIKAIIDNENGTFNVNPNFEEF